MQQATWWQIDIFFGVKYRFLNNTLKLFVYYGQIHMGSSLWGLLEPNVAAWWPHPWTMPMGNPWNVFHPQTIGSCPGVTNMRRTSSSTGMKAIWVGESWILAVQCHLVLTSPSSEWFQKIVCQFPRHNHPNPFQVAPMQKGISSCLSNVFVALSDDAAMQVLHTRGIYRPWHFLEQLMIIWIFQAWNVPQENPRNMFLTGAHLLLTKEAQAWHRGWGGFIWCGWCWSPR